MSFWDYTPVGAINNAVGNPLGIGANQASNEATQNAVDAWQNIPGFTSQANSAYQADPNATAAQQSALAGLQDIVDSNGLTAETKADLAAQQKQNADQERGQREAILANARARGVGGSGLEFASNLENQQGSATRGAEQGFNTAALGEQQKYQALNDLAAQGGAINTQNMNAANAQNAINAFNAANQNQYNLATTQGTGNAYMGQASNYSNQGQIFPNIVGSGLSAAGVAMASDEELKEDVKEFDPDQFLDSITGYKYKYKSPQKYGPGEHASPLAQDLEKTPEGAAIVENTPEGKMVDYGKGFGLLLASMAQIHKDMKEDKKHAG